jgi:hypothetical protein
MEENRIKKDEGANEQSPIQAAENYNSPMNKLCSKCKTVKPIEDFPKCGKGFFRTTCKKCYCENARKLRLMMMNFKKDDGVNLYPHKNDGEADVINSTHTEETALMETAPATNPIDLYIDRRLGDSLGNDLVKNIVEQRLTKGLTCNMRYVERLCDEILRYRRHVANKFLDLGYNVWEDDKGYLRIN